MAVTQTFKGGIHPREVGNGKSASQSQTIVNVTSPARVTIPMSMHVGAPAKCCVKVGQNVSLGQLIGEAQGFISAPVHASVSGKVIALTTAPLASGKTCPAVVIENDFLDTWDENCKPYPETPEGIVEAAKNCGVVGIGGAAFPTHVKLNTTSLDPKPDTLVVNGSECEPYLTSDHRIMVECAAEVADGIRLAMKASGCTSAYVGIEDNKMDAVEALKAQAGSDFEVVALPAKYPQGFEKMLIYALTGRRVPNGALPSAAKCVTMNVGTCLALSQAVRSGRPLIDRVVTVNGRVGNPGNFRVRIGMPLMDLLDLAGGVNKETRKLIIGGAMMGTAVPKANLYVTKNFGGVVALADEGLSPKETACIRCGRCLRACPMRLMPTTIDAYVRRADYDGAIAAGALNCMECGSCTYVCPAKRELTQSIRMAKLVARSKK